VSVGAIRYEGQIEGVYVREGNLIVFKPIERIYSDGSFVLCADLAQGDNRFACSTRSSWKGPTCMTERSSDIEENVPARQRKLTRAAFRRTRPCVGPLDGRDQKPFGR
jgi:hypothetical protein